MAKLVPVIIPLSLLSVALRFHLNPQIGLEADQLWSLAELDTHIDYILLCLDLTDQ